MPRTTIQNVILFLAQADRIRRKRVLGGLINLQRQSRPSYSGAKMDHGYVTSGAGWFTLSLVNAGLAQGKNRSGWNWFLVSLLLGPVATFFIVSWSPLERSDR